MGVEHQLLGLAEVDAHKRHAAVRQLHMRRLDHQRQVLERDRLVAPVELVGFPGREAHRHIGMHRNSGAFVAPSLDEPMHAVVGAVISAPAQLLEQPLGRAALPLRQLGFLLDDLRQNLDPVAKLGRGLNAPRVLELSLVAADDLAHRRARYRQRAYDLLDRSAAAQNRRVVSGRSGPRQSSPQALPGPSGPKGRTLTHTSGGGRNWTRKAAPQGVIIACEFTR